MVETAWAMVVKSSGEIAQWPGIGGFHQFNIFASKTECNEILGERSKNTHLKLVRVKILKLVRPKRKKGRAVK